MTDSNFSSHPLPVSFDVQAPIYMRHFHFLRNTNDAILHAAALHIACETENIWQNCAEKHCFDWRKPLKDFNVKEPRGEVYLSCLMEKKQIQAMPGYCVNRVKNQPWILSTVGPWVWLSVDPCLLIQGVGERSGGGRQHTGETANIPKLTLTLWKKRALPCIKQQLYKPHDPTSQQWCESVLHCLGSGVNNPSLTSGIRLLLYANISL